MPGYEPKGKIEPDPEAPVHTCVHLNTTHSCHCRLGKEHTLDEWIDQYPGEPDTKGE